MGGWRRVLVLLTQYSAEKLQQEGMERIRTINGGFFWLQFFIFLLILSLQNLLWGKWFCCDFVFVSKTLKKSKKSFPETVGNQQLPKAIIS